MKQANIFELLEAIELQNISRVASIIESGIDVNQPGNQVFNTPLAKAVTCECPSIVQLLLKAGAIPDRFPMLVLGDILQKTRYKLSQNLQDILQLLVDANVNLNCLLEIGRTLLMEAAIVGEIDLVKWLVEKGADVNLVNERDSALLCAAHQGRQEVYDYLAPLTAAELLTEAEKELPRGLIFRQRTDDLRLDRFMKAVGSGNLEAIEAALTSGINVDSFDAMGTTALCIIASIGNATIARALIKAGADVNFGEETLGLTPLIEAAGNIAAAIYYGGPERETDHLEVIQLLIEAGADVNLPTRDGYRPLMAAASSGSIKAVKLLLRAGAEVNVADNQGDTALILARDAERDEVVELLKEAGATA